MNRMATAVFATYSQAYDAVRELELVGISGEQVEVATEEAYDLDDNRSGPARKLPAKQAPLKRPHTTLIVRPADDLGLSQARAILEQYGGRDLQSSAFEPPAPIRQERVVTEPENTLGGPGTTGADSSGMDHEGRGKEIRRR